jgi:quercetin dioxygenase-like cupin family protein
MKVFADAAREAVVTLPDGTKRQVLSHSARLMLAQFTFDRPGQQAPLHSHPHEQVGYVVSGEIDFILEGHGSRRLTAGCSYYVPPNTEHGATAITPAVVLDVFTPQRDDFLAE